MGLRCSVLREQAPFFRDKISVVAGSGPLMRALGFRFGVAEDGAEAGEAVRAVDDDDGS
jgi:hypothetical protein